MGINDFIKRRGESPSTKFQRLSNGATNEKKRELEEQLLVPAKIKKYTGPAPIKNALDQLTVKLVLNNQDDMELLSKYFSIGKAGENSIRDVSLLIAVLNALESGEIEYDGKTVKTKSNNYRRKSKMGE